MYLSSENFNLNKQKLQIEARESLIIVCVVSTHCQACIKLNNSIYDFVNIFPDISFGLLNIEHNTQFLSLVKNSKSNIDLTAVPTFLYFKLGVFERVLNINELNVHKFKQELFFELQAFREKNSTNARNITTLEKAYL